MTRFTLMAIALFVVGASGAGGQDPDEVKKLKDRVDLLEKQLKLAEKENLLLKQEIQQLKSTQLTTKKEEPKKQLTLSDRLPVGKVISGSYLFSVGGEAGTSTVTLTERDGNRVKGVYGAKKYKAVDTYPGFIFEGELIGERLTARSIGNAAKRTLTLSMKGNVLEGNLVLVDTQAVAKLSFSFEK